MERFIQMVDEGELKTKLSQAIDGKGAFRRFKDVLMSFAADRERWFTFRSERLRTFMEAWLAAHAIKAIPRPTWGDGPPPSAEELPPDSLMPLSQASLERAGAAGDENDPAPKSQSGRRQRNAESLRTALKELGDALGPRELDLLVAFAEFLKARRAARGFAHHHEHMLQEREAAQSQRGARISETSVKGDSQGAPIPSDKGSSGSL